MTNRVIGPGVTLPPAQALYPPNLTAGGVPYTAACNEISLAPGQSVQLPAGDFMVDLGKYSILQYQDPTNFANISQTVGVWRTIRSQRGTWPVRSDGVNFRIANLTGCAVSAVVNQRGSNYVQATTTVTPSTGTSTWQAIVGGLIAHLTCSVVGANYGLAPLVFLSPPPSPGVQATAVASISGGAINGFTVTNQGAGYITAPTVTILTSPFDTVLGGTTQITAAVAVADLTGSGTIGAVMCTNSGAPVANTMTLTVAGAGTLAAVIPTFLTTLSTVSMTAFGSGTITGAMLTTIGGIPNTNVYTNPAIENLDFIPRQAQVQLTITNGAASGVPTIIDGGMFLNTGTSTVSPIINSYPQNTSATPIAPTVQLIQGSANDTIIVQPL